MSELDTVGTDGSDVAIDDDALDARVPVDSDVTPDADIAAGSDVAPVADGVAGVSADDDSAEPDTLFDADVPAGVDPARLTAAVEAILFVVEAPIAVAALAAAVQRPVDQVQGAIEELRAGYEQRGAGVEVREVAGGVRIYTHPDLTDVVEVFLQDGQRTRLSQAALETLAVIAYRQPVTRARVSAIRGVNVDGVVRTLLARGLVVETGTDPDTGGGLFRTTELFLEKMGLTSLEELPSLAPLLPDVEGLDGLDDDG